MTTLGVFDSGVGGLSVLRHLLIQLPDANLVYLADNAFAPYGERDEATIQHRAHLVTAYLRRQHNITALVIACNTATAHGVDALRARHPDLPIIGMEPALKPAAAMSKSGHVGVLATRGTLTSQRFDRLRRQVELQSANAVQFWPMPCDGLADAIERDQPGDVQALAQRYIQSLSEAGPQSDCIDTIVLGCTHYPFATEALQTALEGRSVRFLDTGLPVAKRAFELLKAEQHAEFFKSPATPPILLSTSDPSDLTKAAQRWIEPSLQASAVVIEQQR